MGKKNRKSRTSRAKSSETSTICREDNTSSSSLASSSAADATHPSVKSSAGAAPSNIPMKGSFRSIQPALSLGVLRYLDEQSFHTMTPVQEATIPLFLTNKDVAVQAVTGSGKTLAFLIPIVERISCKKLAKNQIGALILSPTRELAIQTCRVCSGLCQAMNQSPPLLLTGGGSCGSSTNHRPVTEDLKTFQREASDIVIGTPGRMEDILTRYSVIDVSELEILVLDEADVLLFGKTMMDPTIASILRKLPKMRRTGIFSATTTFTSNTSIQPLLQRAGMRNPVLVNVTVAATPTGPTRHQEDANSISRTDNKGVTIKVKKPTSSNAKATTTYTPASLTNYYLVTKLEEKFSRLVAFVQSHRTEKMIVFFLTCACVEFFGVALQQILSEQNQKQAKDCSSNGMYIELLHGKLVQKRREKAMERFRQSTTGGALFCTDVAARGLDVADVDWVIQVDAPQDPSSFVHRVGRSARAGRKGASLVFLTDKEEAYVDLLANRQVPLIPLPTAEKCCGPVVLEEAHQNEVDNAIDEMEGDGAAAVTNVLPGIKELVLSDRDMLEKGTKAFTSYIRAYKEHMCAFIFRFASLDLGHLATSFCLLRLPKMPELRECQGKLKHFTPAGPEVDIYAIPFLDKVRETARQKRLAAELAAGGKNAKQIKAERRKAEQERRQKERRQAAIEKGRNPNKKRGRHAQIVDEWEELAKEERLYKKFRRGKISKEQYDDLLYGGATKTTSSKATTSSNADGSDEDDSDSS